MIHSDSTAQIEPSQTSIHCLSYDDLHTIFSLCWDSIDDPFPIIASHVCRRWRWFILDMPVFWGRVRFHQEEPRLSMERYATRVQRSKDARLDISINEKPLATSAAENFEAIMELIGPHMERWRSLEIDCISVREIRVFLDHLKGRSLPMLECLRLVEPTRGSRHFNNPESLGHLAFDAPKLKEVELTGLVVDFNSPLFQNLRSLDLGARRLKGLEPQVVKDNIHQLLRQSPHLKQLHVMEERTLLFLEPRHEIHSPPPVGEEPFSHPSLINLRLEFEEAVLDAIILSTRFPSLDSFRAGYRVGYGLNLASWHLPLLARNSPFPSLKKINLSGNPDDRQHDRHLADALCTLGSLEKLGLKRFDMYQVAGALPTLGHSCPRLEALILLKCMRVDLNQVRSMVDMRLRVDGMTGLRKVRIFGGIGGASPELEATEAWLKERVEDVILYTGDD